MKPLSRIGDINQAGGAILIGAGTVLCNGLPVGLHPSVITPHPSFRKKRPKHKFAWTTDGSPTVFCEGRPVLRVTSGNTCGHLIITGSPNVIVS